MPSYLNLVAKTYDPSLVNLTTMTGGDSSVLGDMRSDWLHTNDLTDFNNQLTAFRKIQGGNRIQLYTVTAGGNPDPVIGNTPARTNVFTRTSTDMRASNPPTSFVGSGGAAINVPLADMGNGIGVDFPLTRDTDTFWWLGHTRNGVYTVTATFSDASDGPDTLVLPQGAFNSYEPNWFECSFRGTYAQVADGVTVSITITRTGGASATSAIHNRASVLLVPTPRPMPRGFSPRAH
jgi:hypothetical protein